MAMPVAEVRIDDPGSMNVLGLFLAAAVRRNLARNEGKCGLRGGLSIEAGGMRATLRFGPAEVRVVRGEEDPRARVHGSLEALVRAVARPGLRSLLGVKVRGSRLFALRAVRYLAP